MAPVHALDSFYLGITILVTLGYQLLGFFIAWTFQFDKITDFTGGSNFFLLGECQIDMAMSCHTAHQLCSSSHTSDREHLLRPQCCQQRASHGLGCENSWYVDIENIEIKPPGSLTQRARIPFVSCIEDWY